MRYLTALAILLLVPATVLFAQSSQSMYNTGSIYSYYGIGTVNEFKDPNASAMGMTGVGLSITGTNLSNPAAWSLPVLAKGTGGIEINTLRSKDAQARTSKSVLNVTHVQLVFPIIKSKFGVSVAMYPVSNSRFNYRKTATIDSTLTGGSSNLQYISDYQGSGGLNAMELGFGWSIMPGLSVGYAPSLIFGKLQNTVYTGFNSLDYNQTHYNIGITNIGMGNRFGLYYEHGSVFNKGDLLSVGATASLPVNLKSDRSIEDFLSINGGEINTSRTLDTGHTHLPLRLGFGAGYWFNSHWMLGSELLYQKWSDFKIVGESVSYTKDRMRFGMGGQWMPATSNRPTLLQSLAYRAGFSYDSGYLKLRGEDISSWQLTAGLGIPSRGTASSIDIDVSYGWRGTTSHELVKDRIFSIKVSFNLSELMFFKRKIQ